MAYIPYLPVDEIDPRDRIEDDDNILRIHGINSPVMKQHFELYRQLMHRPGPLSRAQREMVATAISSINQCHY